MSRIVRCLGLLSLYLGLTLVPTSAARAQEEGAATTTSSGNPIAGYLGVAVLGSVAIFALCKTARR